MQTYEMEQETGLDDHIFSLATQKLLSYQNEEATKYPIHYNLRTLSYSSLLTLQSCPRKFELSRLMKRFPVEDPDEHGHLSFGSVVGLGIQEYFCSRSREKALFKMFLSWKENIDEDKAESKGKTFWHALYALEKFIFFAETKLSAYDVFRFPDGEPATELGFDIDFGEGFHFRGNLDILLVHRTTGEFLVFECKTTGLRTVHEAMYKHSGQALGYSVIIDSLASSLGLSNNYRVFYGVYLTYQMEWTDFLFPKSNVQKAAWLQAVLMDITHIQQYAELEHFPMHGQSCFSFGRQCIFFEICTMSNSGLGLAIGQILADIDAEDRFPLKLTIEQLIEDQQSKNDEGVLSETTTEETNR